MYFFILECRVYDPDSGKLYLLEGRGKGLLWFPIGLF